MTNQIETERLLLRPYRASDAEAVATQIGDFKVSKWLTRAPYPYSVQDALTFFDKIAQEPMVYAVCHETDLIGCVSIMGDLGYWCGVAHWGQGFATEAATALVGAHFADSDAPLPSGHLAGNTGSRRVLEKLGFVPTEIVEVECLSRKACVANHRMILTRTAWEART